MVLTFNDTEFELAFPTAAYVGLKKELGCKDLRKKLLKACAEEDLDVLAAAIKRFSGEHVKTVTNAYPCIDQYCADNGVSKQEMFLRVVEEIGDNGFFGSPMTRKELEAEMAAPEIDLEALTNSMIARMGETYIAAELENANIPIGAATSTTFAGPLTAAV